MPSRGRTVAHHVSDVRRTITGYSNKRLLAYIGARVISILEADDALFKQSNSRALSPGLRSALQPLKPLAIGDTNEAD